MLNLLVVMFGAAVDMIEFATCSLKCSASGNSCDAASRDKHRSCYAEEPMQYQMEDKYRSCYAEEPMQYQVKDQVGFLS